MKTILTRSTEVAAGFIKSGGLVAFPTETVYGLGADVFNADAVAAVFAAKRRPADNPLIAHVSDPGQIGQIAAAVGDAARMLIERFFPGPLTIVLRKAERVPPIATAGLRTIGVRMPDHRLANDFIARCGVPVVAPSANLSGRPSPTTWEAVVEDLDGRIDCVLQDDGPTGFGLESTVIDCTADPPVVLRPGAVTLEQLRSVDSRIVPAAPSGISVPKSPGLRHRHYSPRARVVLVPGPLPETLDKRECAYIGISSPPAGFALERVCVSAEDYARSVYEFFRECDRKRIRTICCETVGEEGIGRALMDRLTRAAER